MIRVSFDKPPKCETCVEIVAPTGVYLTPSCLGFIKLDSIGGKIELNNKYLMVDIVMKGSEPYLVISGRDKPRYIKAGEVIGHRIFFCK
ncbi:hypothetical protein BNJ_00350 [Kaumoebavirus]|uniref:hypothetical protein n=1 Tax=Kaumoebavirus TaxID=1859492 RepID=UPI0009C2CB93|nr:hypothetical protein BNJ_00350 [Kaumoebavirus]ARA72170.1 hypothetical protein BNJ_00350 [Kaumoebavirus]